MRKYLDPLALLSAPIQIYRLKYSSVIDRFVYDTSLTWEWFSFERETLFLNEA